MFPPRCEASEVGQAVSSAMVSISQLAGETACPTKTAAHFKLVSVVLVDFQGLDCKWEAAKGTLVWVRAFVFNGDNYIACKYSCQRWRGTPP